MSVQIREAGAADWDAIWPIFRAIVTRGDSYAFDPATSYEDGRAVWIERPRRTFLAEENGEVLGTYYLKTNQDGPGRHVCNCGYMVASAARGRGLATAMCEHSQHIARELGYLAMQFNFVASSNHGAVRLWERLGYAIVGTLPKAFDHPQLGLIDAYVMYKQLAD
ncbi:MAG: GNAT family N-acetyltransferase [Halieaceae bacterium]|jgi:ribosomal protein S18 acetylase RimI-like enzyme|nr:GNAT family N-acetyltransferase [Halieaceae bacterium]